MLLMSMSSDLSSFNNSFSFGKSQSEISAVLLSAIAKARRFASVISITTTGTFLMPSLLAAFHRVCPAIIVKCLSHKIGTLKPKERILSATASTDWSFKRGFSSHGCRASSAISLISSIIDSLERSNLKEIRRDLSAIVAFENR